jgi:hypothetical protein
VGPYFSRRERSKDYGFVNRSDSGSLGLGILSGGIMRIIALVVALAFGSALWPALAGAETPQATVVAAATATTADNAPASNAAADLAQSVPMPREPTVEVSHGRIAAIAIGAAVGVVAANVVTGGMITPLVSAGMAAAPAAAAAQAGVVYASVTMQAIVTAAGALVGGYVGNWFYGK